MQTVLPNEAGKSSHGINTGGIHYRRICTLTSSRFTDFVMNSEDVMNPKPHMAVDDHTTPDTELDTGDHETQEKAQSKKAALQQKCDDIMESLASFQEVYDSILAALAESHEQALQALRNELQQLKDTLPGLEKKSSKRLKLAGTLTAIENESQKAKLKAALRRKKDLNRIDDFVVGAFRTLRALNQKTPGQKAD